MRIEIFPLLQASAHPDYVSAQTGIRAEPRMVVRSPGFVPPYKGVRAGLMALYIQGKPGARKPGTPIGNLRGRPMDKGTGSCRCMTGFTENLQGTADWRQLLYWHDMVALGTFNHSDGTERAWRVVLLSGLEEGYAFSEADIAWAQETLPTLGKGDMDAQRLTWHVRDSPFQTLGPASKAMGWERKRTYRAMLRATERGTFQRRKIEGRWVMFDPHEEPLGEGNGALVHMWIRFLWQEKNQTGKLVEPKKRQVTYKEASDACRCFLGWALDLEETKGLMESRYSVARVHIDRYEKLGVDGLQAKLFRPADSHGPTREFLRVTGLEWLEARTPEVLLPLLKDRFQPRALH